MKVFLFLLDSLFFKKISLLHKHQDGNRRRSSNYGEFNLLDGEDSYVKTRCKFVYSIDNVVEGDFHLTNFRLIFRPPTEFLLKEYIIYDYFHVPLMLIHKYDCFIKCISEERK